MALLLIEGAFCLLGAPGAIARSNQWARSEQQAVSLVARGRFSPSERPFLSQREAVLLFFPGQGIFARWAGRKFSLSNVPVMTMTVMTVGVFIF